MQLSTGVEGDPVTPLSVMFGVVFFGFSHYLISLCSFVPWKVEDGAWKRFMKHGGSGNGIKRFWKWDQIQGEKGALGQSETNLRIRIQFIRP